MSMPQDAVCRLCRKVKAPYPTTGLCGYCTAQLIPGDAVGEKPHKPTKKKRHWAKPSPTDWKPVYTIHRQLR